MSDTRTEISDDEARDDALEETFPASDPPAIGGSTGPGDQPADTLEDNPSEGHPS